MSAEGIGPEIKRLADAMSAVGVRRLLVKALSPNDNSKNQVYLGQDFSALNLLPSATPEQIPGKPQAKAALNMLWMRADGQLTPAPGAQLILYPQYPEIRMSGFLRGSPGAPSDVMTSREPGRILFLGVCDDGRIVGTAIEAASELAGEVRRASGFTQTGVFLELPIPSVGGVAPNSRDQLLRTLTDINAKGWIESRRLSPGGGWVPCISTNCGGYTLEAELGITPNGIAEPDYLGWEIKQHAVRQFSAPASGVLTLMTPEPTEGLYKDDGPIAFVQRFGYPDRAGRPDRLNFGGVYRAGQTVALTGLRLELAGYDSASGRIVDWTGGITLRSPSGEKAAAWPYPSMMKHWQRKHALAAYVPSVTRDSPTRQYWYGDRVRLGLQTDFLLFLGAVQQGVVFYDPGIKLEGVSSPRPRLKRRSQFRVLSVNLPSLYKTMETVQFA